jgi:hypothetical protein
MSVQAASALSEELSPNSRTWPAAMAAGGPVTQEVLPRDLVSRHRDREVADVTGYAVVSCRWGQAWLGGAGGDDEGHVAAHNTRGAQRDRLGVGDARPSCLLGFGRAVAAVVAPRLAPAESSEPS